MLQGLMYRDCFVHLMALGKDTRPGRPCYALMELFAVYRSLIVGNDFAELAADPSGNDRNRGVGRDYQILIRSW